MRQLRNHQPTRLEAPRGTTPVGTTRLGGSFLFDSAQWNHPVSRLTPATDRTLRFGLQAKKPSNEYAMVIYGVLILQACIVTVSSFPYCLFRVRCDSQSSFTSSADSGRGPSSPRSSPSGTTWAPWWCPAAARRGAGSPGTAHGVRGRNLGATKEAPRSQAEEKLRWLTGCSKHDRHVMNSYEFRRIRFDLFPRHGALQT